MSFNFTQMSLALVLGNTITLVLCKSYSHAIDLQLTIDLRYLYNSYTSDLMTINALTSTPDINKLVSSAKGLTFSHGKT